MRLGRGILFVLGVLISTFSQYLTPIQRRRFTDKQPMAMIVALEHDTT